MKPSFEKTSLQALQEVPQEHTEVDLDKDMMLPMGADNPACSLYAVVILANKGLVNEGLHIFMGC